MKSKAVMYRNWLYHIPLYNKLGILLVSLLSPASWPWTYAAVQSSVLNGIHILLNALLSPSWVLNNSIFELFCDWNRTMARAYMRGDTQNIYRHHITHIPCQQTASKIHKFPRAHNSDGPKVNWNSEKLETAW